MRDIWVQKAEFEVLVKVSKTASYFRFRKITKSKEPIKITLCAGSLVNGEYNSVGFISRSQLYLSKHSIEFG